MISSHPGNEWTESTLQFRTYKKINNKLRQKRSFNPTVATTVNNNTKILNNNLPSNVSIWTIQPNILRAHMMLLPYKSRHLLRKKSVFFAWTGRSVIQFYNKLAAIYWLPMFWPRRRPGTHGTHFVSMSGPTVHPYTVHQRVDVRSYRVNVPLRHYLCNTGSRIPENNKLVFWRGILTFAGSKS